MEKEKLIELTNKIIEVYEPPFGIEFILPRGYDISAQIIKANTAHNLSKKNKVVLFGVLSNFRVKYRGRLANIYANLSDETGSVMLNWTLSQKAGEFKCNILRNEFNGMNCQCLAEIDSYGEGVDRFVFLKKVKLKVSANIGLTQQSITPTPIYELKSKIKEFEIMEVIKEKIITYRKKSSLPVDIINKYQLPTVLESLQYIHGMKEIPVAHQIDFAEGKSLWNKRIQLEMIWNTLIAMDNESFNKASPRIKYNKEELIALEEKLPFNLTESQKKSLGNIFKTLQSGSFERMLLQGDVGSGKTLVSIFASYVVAKSAFNQIAVIAPSTVLATQLAEEYTHMLEPMGILVFKSAGTLKKREKTKIQKALNSDVPMVVVGTTSVNSFDFKRLGLLIIDEEQKMGVKSKDKLLNQLVSPYQILMSATPIPRSLAQAIYGNVKVVKIESKPAGRLPVLTKIIPNEHSLSQLFIFIAEQARLKLKTLFVAPSIASGELASIEDLVVACEKYLPGTKVGIINGSMKEEEISKTIDDFKNDDHHILIATSMVEAGFSVPNMTAVVIYGPDRFGLSQLHQIRGRGGRASGVQAYCALLPRKFELSDKARERLTFFSKNHDGFELSKTDLKNRGSGELMGKEQTGGGKLNFVEYQEEVMGMKKYIK